MCFKFYLNAFISRKQVLNYFVQELTAELDRLRSMLDEKNNQDRRNQELEDKLIELDTVVTDLEERLADTEARLTEVTADRDRAEAELADARANLDTLQTKLLESATNIEPVQAKLTEAKSHCEQAEARAKKATADSEAARAELAKWKVDCEAARAELAKWKDDCETALADLASCRLSCEKALAELADERLRSASSSQQLDIYSAQIRRLNADLAQRNSEVLSFVELIKKLKKAFAPKVVDDNVPVSFNGENDPDVADAGLTSPSSPTESGVESGGVSSDELPQLVADSSAFVAELLQQQLDTSDLRNHLTYAEERCTELEQILARYQQEAADR
jgi:DNA repair exonuclease SbcCD ATPase subunit